MNTAYIKFSRQTVVSTLASIFVYSRGIVLIPVMTRGLSPADYGIWIQIYGLSELLVVVGSMGLQGGMLRFWHQAQQRGTAAREMSTIYSAVALGCLLLGTLVAATGDSLAWFLWDEPTAGAHFDLLLVLLPVSALLQLTLTAFRADRRVVMHSGLLIAEAIGFVGIAIYLLASGGGVRQVLIALAATRIVVFFVAYLTILNRTGWQWPVYSVLRPYLTFSLPLLPIGLFMWVSNMGDRYIISHFSGPGAVAEYSIHYSIGSLVGLFFSPVFFVLTPMIIQLWEQQQHSDLFEYLKYAQKYPLLIIAPTLVLLTLHTDEAIELIATDAYTSSSWLILAIGGGVLFINLSALAENVVCLVLKTRMILAIYGCAAAVNLLMNLIAIPLWGIHGAALATLTTFGLQFSALHWYSRRHFAPYLYWSMYLRVAVASALMSGTARFVDTSPVLGILLACAVYIAALLTMGCVERRELALVRAIFRPSDHSGNPPDRTEEDR